MLIRTLTIVCCIPAVDNSYDGPHLEDGKVTLDFVQQLLTRFKDQKKIHKKYAYTVRNLTADTTRKVLS